MQPPSTRTFTASRIVALALVAALAGGLAYLRFAPDAGVSVPEGARAGQLILEDCDYATEDGTYAADCGTLVVPENRADPSSRLIALPVTRIRARSKSPAEPIVRLEGGPGKSNMDFPIANRYAQNHDVVLVGYRGADGSSILDCPEVVSAFEHSTDLLSDETLRSYGDGLGECAERLADEGVDLDGYTLTQRVEDLEAARVGLGYDRVDLLSESAGTRTALIYAWRHPERIHRSVMVAPNPPGHFLWKAKTTDEQLRRYSDHCAEDDACSERTEDLVASVSRTVADIPDRWGFLPIKEGNVLAATFWGMHETTEENAPLTSPMTLGAWLAADNGDASGFWLLSFAGDLTFPSAFIWGEFAATARIDAAEAREYFAGRPDSILDDPGTRFIWADGRLADALPPAPDAGEYSRMRTSNVETLLVSGELDITTPPQVAEEKLLPYLPNGRQVVLDGFAHSLDFWTYQPEVGTRMVTTFLETGRVDDSHYRPQVVDFTPEVTDTALAKGFAGTMVGVGLLAVLSLLWMARRVHKRGRFGRTSSALLRSVYAVVLGFGGWFIGVLFVMTAMSGVFVGDDLVAIVSIGVPVGLGIYLAWVHGDRSARSKLAGLAAAVVGAFAGAWFGFHATVDLLALVTAIAGAIAGSNLALILLDLSKPRSVAERVEATSAPTVA
jgi:pimeloyl-ACP methyl ester carboxylesterase